MAQEKFVAILAHPRDMQDDQTPVRIRRGRVDSVDLYEIKDSELDLLEKGSPADLQLNFAIFLLSLAFSTVGTLATATFTNPIIANIFIIIFVVGFLLGSYLLLSWLRFRTSLRILCRQIRSRIPPDKLPPTPVGDPSESVPDDKIRPAG